MTWTIEQHTMRGGGRYYTATNTETGERRDLWSPTTVINEAAKPNIDRWKQRMVAIGICARADLREMIATDDEDAQKEAVQQALEAGKQAANRGTARHAVAERITTAADAFEVAAEGEILGSRRGRIEASNISSTGLRVHVNVSWLAGLNEIVGHLPTHVDARRGALVWRDPESEATEAVLMGVWGEFDEVAS